MTLDTTVRRSGVDTLHATKATRFRAWVLAGGKFYYSKKLATFEAAYARRREMEQELWGV